MASLDMMYNSTKQKGHHHNNNNNNNHHCAPMSPRISFSNDFVDIQQAMKQERSIRSETNTPVSSDFEFSVTNYSMMSADELFSKGRLLPYKDNCNNKMQRVTTTLKEELLNNDDEYDTFSLRPPKGRWKGLLGLRKSHIGSKKVDKTEASQITRPNDGPPFNFTSQVINHFLFF